MRWVIHVRCLLLMLLLTSVALRANEASEATLILAEVSVNGINQGVTLLARDDRGHFFADTGSLDKWRIENNSVALIELAGRQWVPLSGFTGIEAELDESSMALALTVPSELRPRTTRSLARSFEASGKSSGSGAFVDYDLSYTRHATDSLNTLSGLLTPTWFTDRGSLTAEILYDGGGYDHGAVDRGWRRLSTSWTYDDPLRMRSIRLGDTVSSSLSWSRSLRFAGFQIASNFETRPTEVTFPQPTIAGTAAVPTTLDIYVNGQVRSRVDVPGGAFEINDIPVVTGSGQVQVVARDILGREQVIAQDFYSSEQLLRPGLNEYSVSVGRLREDYALTSNNYGDAMLSAVLRRGISDRLTLAGQFESAAGRRMLGLSVAVGHSGIGVSQASLARSTGNGTGTLWQLGHQYQGRRFRADVRVLGTTRAFAQPGLLRDDVFAKRQFTVSGGVSLGYKGSIGASLVRERSHDSERRSIASMSYSRSLTRGFMLSAALSRVETDESHLETRLTLTRSLGPRASTSVGFSRREDGHRTRIDHRYDLPSGPGFGYRLSHQQGTQDISDAEFLFNTAHARYGAEYRVTENHRAYRLQSRGSVAFFDKAWFATREISDGFAVVDAGGLDGVRVYLENRDVGVTREDGRLLVPGLRPYENNRLRIELADVPITARVDEPSLVVTPYYRAGSVASFGIRDVKSVVMTVRLPDGSVIPEGAQARLETSERIYPVGLGGRLYLEEVSSGTRARIRFGEGVCDIELPELVADKALMNLGTMDCVPEAPR